MSHGKNFVLIISLILISNMGSLPNYKSEVISSSMLSHTILVDINGTGEYSSIQRAIDNAKEGDTIQIMPGEYREHLTIGKAIKIEGSKKSYPIVNGTLNGTCAVISNNNVNMENIIFKEGLRNEYKHYYCGLYIKMADNCTFSNITVLNCDIGVNVESSKNITFRRCILKGPLIDDFNHYSALDVSSSVNVSLYDISMKAYNCINMNNDLRVMLTDSTINGCKINIKNSNTVLIRKSHLVQLSSFNDIMFTGSKFFIENNSFYRYAIYIPSESFISNNSFTKITFEIRGINVSIINNSFDQATIWRYTFGEDEGFIRIIGNIMSNSTKGIDMTNGKKERIEIIDNKVSKMDDRAIWIHSDYNADYLIINNTIYDNNYGLMIYSYYPPTVATVMYNTFEENNLGMDIYEVSIVYRNNFLNNTNQCNGPYYSYNGEGNYFSDYKGKDNGAKSRLRGDGIGDTDLPCNNDEFPFMVKDGWKFPGKTWLTCPENFSNDGSIPLSWYKTRCTRYSLERINGDDKKIIYSGVNTSFVDYLDDGNYSYCVRAEMDQNVGAWSYPYEYKVDLLPEAPKNLTVMVNPEGNAVNLAWKTSGKDVRKFQIYQNALDGWKCIKDVSFPSMKYEDNGLIDGSRYSYKVLSVDGRGQESEFSNIVSAIPMDTTPPNPPVNFSGFDVTNSSIGLRWNPVSKDSLYYVLERSDLLNTTWIQLTNGSYYQTTFIDRNLLDDTTYRYRVRCCDEAFLLSEPSGIIEIRTKILEYPPEIKYKPKDIKIREDSSYRFNISGIFEDRNHDNLTYFIPSLSHIEKKMEGFIIILYPEENWNGMGSLCIFCRDGMFNVSLKIPFEVSAINDPPYALVFNNSNLICKDGNSIWVHCSCNDPDIIYGDILNITWKDGIKILGYCNDLCYKAAGVGNHTINVVIRDQGGYTIEGNISLTVVETALSDSDADGMSNVWERAHGLDPFNPTDAKKDLDKDGFTNLEEYILGTDPSIRNAGNDDNQPKTNRTDTNATKAHGTLVPFLVGVGAIAFLATLIFVIVLISIRKKDRIGSEE